MGWLGAQWKHLHKYIQYYNACGMDVVALNSPITCIVSHREAQRTMEQYVRQLMVHCVHDVTKKKKNSSSDNSDNSDGSDGSDGSGGSTGSMVQVNVNLIVHVLSGNGLYMYGHMIHYLMDHPSPLVGVVSHHKNDHHGRNEQQQQQSLGDDDDNNSLMPMTMSVRVGALIIDSSPPVLSPERFTDGFLYALFYRSPSPTSVSSTATSNNNNNKSSSSGSSGSSGSGSGSSRTNSRSLWSLWSSTMCYYDALCRCILSSRIIRSLVTRMFAWYLNREITVTTTTSTQQQVKKKKKIRMTRTEYIEQLKRRVMEYHHHHHQYRSHNMTSSSSCSQSSSGSGGSSRSPPPPPPPHTLFIYSESDRVVPASDIESFIQEWRRMSRGGSDNNNNCNNGDNIEVCKFKESDHVAHLRSHPREYTSRLHEFIQRALLNGCEATKNNNQQ